MLSINPKEIEIPKLHRYLLGSIGPRPIAFASTVDAEGRPPAYELFHLNDVMDITRFGLVTALDLEFDQHVAEMSENSADYYHFQTLHRPLPLPCLETEKTCLI